MSSKINVKSIIAGHIKTLHAGNNEKISWVDLLVFFFIPLAISVIFLYFQINISKEVASLLVNFGAIFTALLLSVLVLVYEQSNKLKEKKDNDIFYNLKVKLLNELYYNICYSVLISIALVVICLLHSIMFDVSSQIKNSTLNFDFTIYYGKYFFSPITAFLTSNVVLTIVMVVKRMHTLLTTDAT
jgi:hypothetical protein